MLFFSFSFCSSSLITLSLDLIIVYFCVSYSLFTISYLFFLFKDFYNIVISYFSYFFSAEKSFLFS